MPTLNLGREPVAIITTIVVALGALNTQVPTLSSTVHDVISAALVVLGAILARAAVTPAAAPKLALAEPAPSTVAELLALAQAAEAATAVLAVPSPEPPAEPGPAPAVDPGPSA